MGLEEIFKDALEKKLAEKDIYNSFDLEVLFRGSKASIFKWIKSGIFRLKKDKQFSNKLELSVDEVRDIICKGKYEEYVLTKDVAFTSKDLRKFTGLSESEIRRLSNSPILNTIVSPTVIKHFSIIEVLSFLKIRCMQEIYSNVLKEYKNRLKKYGVPDYYEGFYYIPDIQETNKEETSVSEIKEFTWKTEATPEATPEQEKKIDYKEVDLTHLVPPFELSDKSWKEGVPFYDDLHKLQIDLFYDFKELDAVSIVVFKERLEEYLNCYERFLKNIKLNTLIDASKALLIQRFVNQDFVTLNNELKNNLDTLKSRLDKYFSE